MQNFNYQANKEVVYQLKKNLLLYLILKFTNYDNQFKKNK